VNERGIESRQQALHWRVGVVMVAGVQGSEVATAGLGASALAR
jgi:hypothetical protein